MQETLLEYFKSIKIILILEVITVLIGFYYLFSRKVSKAIKLYLYFLTFNLFIDIIVLYVATMYFGESNYFGFIDEVPFFANFWQYNFVEIIATSFHLYFFGRLLNDKKQVSLLKGLGVAFVLTSIFIFIFIEDVFFNQVSTFVTIGGSSLLLLAIFFYLMKVLEDQQIIKGQERFPIFIVGAAGIYHVASLPIFIYSYSDYNPESKDFVIFNMQAMEIIVVIVFLIYISGFCICLSKKKT